MGLGRPRDVEPEPVDVSACVVTAVLVAFEAAAWLPDTLGGIAALRQRPDRLIAIDNDSDDATGALLRQALQRGVLDAVYRGHRTYGFGAGGRLGPAAGQGHRRTRSPAPFTAAPAERIRNTGHLGSGCCTMTLCRHLTRWRSC